MPLGSEIPKTVLVADFGHYSFVARALAPSFRRLLYWTPWERGFSQMQDAKIGSGLPGVERIDFLFDALDAVDLVVFPDVGMGDLQAFLRERGMPVFGCGAADLLEHDRIDLKRILEKKGAPVAKWIPIHGMETLRRVLGELEDVYVKFSRYRKDLETYHHEDAFRSEPWLDDLARTLGPLGHEATFLVEMPIQGDPCVEVGWDGFCVDGQFPRRALFGFEVKDAAYLGHAVAERDLPKVVVETRDLLAPELKERGMRGFYSTEARVLPDAAYLTDPTCRAPSPPMEVSLQMFGNWPEVIVAASEGRVLDLEPRGGEVAVELILRSDWAVDHFLPVEIDRDFRPNVRLHRSAVIDGRDVVFPLGFREFGAATGVGNTIEEAMRLALEAAEAVHGYGVEWDQDALSKAVETVQTAEKLGMAF